MNLLEIKTNLAMSSREIAELTNKQHQHVKRDIEKILKELSKDMSSFGRIYFDSMNREQTEYLLPHHELTVLLTGYSIPLRSKVLKRWQELETNTLPSYQINDPVKRAETWILEEKERQRLNKQITEDKPYTDFAKAIENSSDSITIGQFSKLLTNEGVKIGRNKLFVWFRENGYLIKKGRDHNVPVQRYIEQGLFEIKETVIHAITKDFLKTSTLITGKGQMYFLNKFIKAEM